jgi:hypothetical protein
MILMDLSDGLSYELWILQVSVLTALEGVDIIH